MKTVKIDDCVLTQDGRKHVVEIRCDALSDITPADSDWMVGSLAAVAEEQSIFMLKSDGTWVDMMD